MNTRSFALIIALSGLSVLHTQAATIFHYFYDDANELYRVLDSTGTLIEYTYDPSGNIANVSRTTLASTQLSILNVTPSTSPVNGSKITILGQNFSALTTGDTVMIGGLAATVISATATQLVVLVPSGTAGGAISVTVGGVTATWSSNVTVAETPSITSISPASGKAGATVTVTVTGQDLSGATFALTSVNPIDTAAGAAVTVSSNTGTTAILTLVLGTTQGQFALTGTNTNGTGPTTPGSLFIIGPVNNSVDFYISVLNSGFNPTTNPPLPAGQNSASFFTSVLNTGYNTTTNPPFPPGKNSVSFYASVLNAGFNPTVNPPLPAGQNTANFFTSVLNTSDNTTTNPPFPPGNNSVSYHASVLNTGFNPANNPPLPAGQNTVSYFVSVCNTSFGCTATAPAIVSVNAPPTPVRQRSTGPSRGSPPTGSLPILHPLEEITRVTTGQTIRLAARDVAPGSIVEFDVNQVIVATIGEAPYETLFTVPDGTAELTFQVIVRNQGQPDSMSQISRVTVVPDAGAIVSGSVTPAGNGVELSLAADGLKAEFFHLAQPVTARPALDELEPVRSGYVTAINQPNPAWIFGADPMGAHLATDYAVRFSGEMRAETAGQYQFWLAARSGAAISIDGKLLADTGFVAGEPAETPVSATLDQGWHSIDVIYYLAVGNSSLRLEWQQPNGTRREVLGPEYLRTVLAGTTTISAADGTFAFPQVPRRFDTVWIRVKRGDVFIEFSGVAPGADSVLIAVPK